MIIKNSAHILVKILMQILFYSLLLMISNYLVYIRRVLFKVIQLNFIIINFEFVCKKIMNN
jgi:hypothetical protein